MTQLRLWWHNPAGRLALLLIATGLLAITTHYLTGYLLLALIPDQLHRPTRWRQAR